MPETFHTWFMPALGIVIAIVGIIISIYIQRRPKRLSYRILQAMSVVTVKEKLSDKLQVLYDGEPVQDVTLVTLRIVNSGKKIIDIEDFLKSIRIVPLPGTSILAANLINTNPEGIDVEYTVDEFGITIEPLVLNPKDSIDFKLVMNHYNDEIEIHTRIKEVPYTNLPPLRMGVKSVNFWGTTFIILNAVLMTLVFFETQVLTIASELQFDRLKYLLLVLVFVSLIMLRISYTSSGLKDIK